MSDENEDIPMAQCGACGSIVPLDSESCPNCGVRFGGVTDEELGECGACGAIIPADSESCPECGASFVEVEESTSVPPVEEIEEAAVSDSLDELNDIILPEITYANNDILLFERYILTFAFFIPTFF